jgi:Arc/MetJ-type ribon-helix-helix transcriptional regulator
MPEKLAFDIQRLVKKGLYKNRSEVVIDAIRHFLGGNRTGDIASHLEERLIGKTEGISYNKEEMDWLWARVRQERLGL